MNRHKHSSIFCSPVIAHVDSLAVDNQHLDPILIMRKAGRLVVRLNQKIWGSYAVAIID